MSPAHSSRRSASASPARSLTVELRRIVVAIGLGLGLLWGLEIVDQFILLGRLDRLMGVVPRSAAGAIGIPLHAFAHGDFGHLISNTVGLAILGTIVAGYGVREWARVTVISILVAGAGVWLIAPAGSITVGASGLLFGYFAYALARGFYERRVGSILLACFVAVTQGALLFGMVPGLVPGHVSWQAHLCGFVGGILAARRFRR